MATGSPDALRRQLVLGLVVQLWPRSLSTIHATVVCVDADAATVVMKNRGAVVKLGVTRAVSAQEFPMAPQ